MLIFNQDASSLELNRVNIQQMSVTNRKGLEEAVHLCLTYIWEHTKAEEVRIGLHHFEVEEKGKTVLRVDEEYKAILKRFNFKWKQMISKARGSRILVLGLMRPEAYPLDKEVCNPFHIKLASFFTIEEERVDPSKNKGLIEQ